jgi:hypothetical protein
MFPDKTSAYTSFTLYTCHMPILYTCHMSTHLLLFALRILFFWGVQIVKFLIMLFSRTHYYLYFLALRTKCLSQHLNLEHPQPTFLPSCERPSFTAMDNRKKIIPYVTTFVLVDNRGRQVISEWMVADIPRIDSGHNFFIHAICIY